MKLTNPTEDQINAAVAEKVAGWKNHRDGYWLAPGTTPQSPLHDGGMFPPQFTRSMDAVLPYLEKEEAWFSQKLRGNHYTVTVGVGWVGQDKDSLPLACCIALLRANGVEVEYTDAPCPRSASVKRGPTPCFGMPF